MEPEIPAQLQGVLATGLPLLMQQGQELIKKLPPKQPKLAFLVFISLEQRLFLWLEDIHQGFQKDLISSYFTSALLTRGLMETAATIVWIERDTTGDALAAFVAHGEKQSKKRRDGLARLITSSDSEIASAAQNETKEADGILAAIAAIKNKSQLSATSLEFPSMFALCEQNGAEWLFMYNALYRELCEAAHPSLAKIPHAPSLAMRAPGDGAPVIYEHSRTMLYALQYWGISILETCKNHPDQSAFQTFREQLFALHDACHPLLKIIQATSENHSLPI